MEIASCPECGRPRAIGHRCPSCGDTTTLEGVQPESRAQPESSAASAWQADTRPWQGSAGPAQLSAGRKRGLQGRGSAGTKSRRGVLATVIVSLVVVAIVTALAVILTTGGKAVVEEQAAVAAAPERGYDQAAKSLLRNAMTAMNSAFVESADFTKITQSSLEALEPAIAWMRGGAMVCASPSSGAKAQQYGVAWACTGRMTYELGTWSQSGVAFGVRVDKAGGRATYYCGGKTASW